MRLRDAHATLAAALAPLGIEVGPEVLAAWSDRQKHGTDPLPVDALRRLADAAGRLAREQQ